MDNTMKAKEPLRTKIPQSIRMAGQRIDVYDVKRCEDNCMGICSLSGGYIEIADFLNKDTAQTPDCKRHTFYHELTHLILGLMNEQELNNNEKFVNTFSAFLTEAMDDAEFVIRR
jgi:hypothetical protein